MYNQISANRNRTALLMAIFFVLVVGLGYALSYYYNDISILWFAVIFSIFVNWFSYFNSDKIALASNRARPANAYRDIEERQLINLVENLSITVGVPAPKVYIINDPALNAFATGRDPKHASIAVTSGLMEALTKSEMEGVLSHELSHIKNYDILLSTITVTLVGIITLVGDWFMRVSFVRNSDNDGDHSGNPLAIVAIVFIILSPLFAQLIQLAVSRRREFLADASGALMTRYPEGLANALEKLEQHNQPLKTANRATAHLFIVSPFTDSKLGKQATNLFSTHPPIAQRVKILREMTL
jgi:heat shock protein HtpX